MAKRHNSHLNMGEALNEFIQKNKLQKGIDKVDAREAWASLMGNGVNNYTTNVELKNDTLFVSLSSAVHGSDSDENAGIEGAFHFAGSEVY